jgi:HSP20 family protein
MALIRWTPFRSVMSLRDEMDKLLDDFYGRMAPSSETYEGDWLPAMDMKETDGEVVATIELPGLTKEDIKVSVKNDVLSVSGEKKQESTETAGNVHRVERAYGYFKRSVRLPVEVDSAKVSASYKDGLLTVTMPKVEAKKAKEIPIKVS